MAVDGGQARLFGSDLKALWLSWKAGWQEASRWPVFARFGVAHPVALVETGADGQRLWWHAYEDGRARRLAGAPALTLPVAVLLPADRVLVQSFRLPLVDDADVAAAVALHVASHSPFPLEQRVQGWRAQPVENGLRVDVVMASRALMQAQLEAIALAGRQPAEVWARVDDGFVVIQGAGEALRREAERVARQRISLLGLGALGLFLLVMLTPAVQSWMQLKQAEAALVQAQGESRAAVALRDELSRLESLAAVVQAQQTQGVDVVRWLDVLSRLLPDSVWLDRLDMQGASLRLSGRADDAAALMETLGKEAAFANVRAPSATSRDPATGKERFVIEIDLRGGGQ